MTIRCTLLITCILTVYFRGHSQNLIPNAGFESTNYCEDSSGTWIFGKNIDSHTLPGWTFSGGAYFNQCHEYFVEKPGTMFERRHRLYIGARNGTGYVNLFFPYSSFDDNKNVTIYKSGNSFAICQLDSALVAGEKYLIEAWVRLDSGSTVVQNQIGFDFSDSIVSFTGSTFITRQSLVHNDTKFIPTYLDETSTWTRVFAVHLAKGGEMYFVIGGLLNNGVATKPANKARYLAYHKKRTANNIGSSKEDYKRMASLYDLDKHARYHFDDISVTLIP